MTPVFYLIPGLGADERVFRHWQLAGETHLLRWLPLQSAAETLPHYAARLAAGVRPGQPCWLVGVSFGGLLALEIARLRPLARVALVSSMAGPQQLPRSLRIVRALGLHWLVPPQVLQQLPRLAGWFFSVGSRSEYALLRQILHDTDPQFARWAIGQLLHWPGTGAPAAVRIHGTHDRLLPAGAGPVEYALPGAGHFMVVSHARQVCAILNRLATELPAAA